jgi:hypothetical protein
MWQDKKRTGTLWLNFRTQVKYYRKRGAAKNKRGMINTKINVLKGDPIVEKSGRFDDLENDFIIEKDDKGAIVTISDMATMVNSDCSYLLRSFCFSCFQFLYYRFFLDEWLMFGLHDVVDAL